MEVKRMYLKCKHMQIVKHALQYYIQREGADEHDLVEVGNDIAWNYRNFRSYDYHSELDGSIIGYCGKRMEGNF